MKKLEHVLVFVISVVAFASASAASSPHPEGFVVTAVVPEGAASRAGVLTGDRLVMIGDRKMESQKDLDDVVSTHEAGDSVRLRVRRAGELLDLDMVFQKRPDGRPSIGLSLSMPAAGGSTNEFAGPTLARTECVPWVEKRYRLQARIRDLALDFEDDAEALIECLAKDVQRMPSPMPVGWCDNAFKIHCSGIELLTEIGEAFVQSCQQMLGEQLSRCADQRIFDRYTRDGLASDLEQCTAARDACAADQQ